MSGTIEQVRREQSGHLAVECEDYLPEQRVGLHDIESDPVYAPCNPPRLLKWYFNNLKSFLFNDTAESDNEHLQM
jgi:hypothetical protein